MDTEHQITPIPYIKINNKFCIVKTSIAHITYTIKYTMKMQLHDKTKKTKI